MIPFRTFPAPVCVRVLTASVLGCFATVGLAQTASGESSLNAITITSTRADLQGVADSASEGLVTRKQIETRPLSRPGEVVESVPGMVATQHSGGGKANQYFLRGFNLDHGTDFATFVDGVPVNLPTHAHGHGYTDLNFLIPELVDSVYYRKGPYFAQEGDFSAAGSARIKLVRKLDQPLFKLEAGGGGYRRALAAQSHPLAEGDLLYALEVGRDNGPWEVPQNLSRSSGVIKFSQGTADNGLEIGLNAYNSRWTSTDQVPQAAIDSGLIGRFGSLDPTDGGTTSRVTLHTQWTRTAKGERTEVHAWVMRYRLDLFSNYTFATSAAAGCDDTSGAPLPALCNTSTALDQFEQVDRRTALGFSGNHRFSLKLAGHDLSLRVGTDYRQDRIGEVGLFDTLQRQRTGTTRDDRVTIHALGLWSEADLQWNEQWHSHLGLRYDRRDVQVQGNLAANNGSAGAGIVSPKFNLTYAASPTLDLHANWGRGYHSNDARGALLTVDPKTGAPADRSPLLVRATGYELGSRWKATPRLTLTSALWWLNLDSELVFAGDQGITEPSHPSRRHGIELTSNWRATPAWEIDGDLSLSRARYVDNPVGPYIANAQERVLSVGATWQQGPWTAGARLRHFGSHPLVEDNSLRGAASTLVNTHAAWRMNRQVEWHADVFNLLNQKAADIQYAYASRLPGEPGFDGSVNRIHVHPSLPRTVRVGVQLSF